MDEAEIRLRPAARADERFFREMEISTTWASLASEDRARLSRSEFVESLEATHALLRDRAGSQVVVAESPEGERVGLLWMGLNRNLVTGEEEAWIYNISVLPQFQGRGIGSLLLAHAEKLAREAGYATLGLMVSWHNERARRLYERSGFAPANLVMRKQITGE